MAPKLQKRVIKFPDMSFEEVLETQKQYIAYLREVFGAEAADKYVERLKTEYERARKKGETEIILVSISDESTSS
ncbi:MAG: hypothetical protein NZ921_05060 [Candidatus Caldarchaeum sp.]|nr:hypothetical protein [Candidatus Caldarchaeum sp.]